MDKENLQVLSINNIKILFNRFCISKFYNICILYIFILLYWYGGTVPNYMKIYLAISLLLWLILYLQEKGKILADFNRNNY